MSCDFGFPAVSLPQEHTFLSYSRNDCDIIAPIAKLINEQCPIWYDEGLIAGEKWEPAIIEQVRCCKMAVFFVSRDLFGRENSYVCDEFRFVTDHAKTALCVWLDDLRYYDVRGLSDPMYKLWNGLSVLPCVSIYDKATNEEKATAVIAALDGLIKKDLAAPNTDIPQNNTTPTPKPQPKPQPKPKFEPSPKAGFGKSLGTKLLNLLSVAIPAAAVAVAVPIAAQQYVDNSNDDDIVQVPEGPRYVVDLQSSDEANERDILLMGEHDGSPIEWIVLDKDGDDLLLLSHKILATKPFEDMFFNFTDEEYIDFLNSNQEYTEISENMHVSRAFLGTKWWNCSLRNWLNEDFINEFFTSAELRCINYTTIVTPDSTPNPTSFDSWDTYIIDGGDNSNDRMFLLSIDEYNMYKAYIEDAGEWWLRSPGCYIYARNRVQALSDNCAQIVSESYEEEWDDERNAHYYRFGLYFEEESGVRPAMWVHIG